MKKLIEVVLVILSAAVAHAATGFDFVTIAVPVAAPYTTYPTGINNNQVIVGYYEDKIGYWHGFTYNTEKHTWVYPINDPNAPMPYSTYATAINDSGVVAGYYTAGLHQGYNVTFGFTETSGVFSDVIVPCGSQLTTQIAGINNVGFTVGSCTISGLGASQMFSWVWALGDPTVFECPANELNSAASAINNNGQVVGWYLSSSNQNGGYVSGYGNCGYAVSYPGVVSSLLTGLDDYGTAIGWASPSNAAAFGFFYDISTAQFTRIKSPAAAKFGLITGGMNNNGSFVGYYVDQNGHNNAFVAKLAK